MDRKYYLTAIESNSALLALAASQGLDGRPPCCPDWTVGQLVQHLGQVYEFVGDVVSTRAQEPDVEALHARHLAMRKDRDDSFARSPTLVSWYRERIAHLLEVFARADPREPVWTWFPPQQEAGFWQRRMAHETAIHRWDVQEALGVTESLDLDLAVDGVDEALTVHVHDRRPDAEIEGKGETFAFVCADADGRWLVRMGKDDAEVQRVGSEADVVVRGAASDLDLFLWQRIPASRLNIRGDANLLDRWFDLVPPD